MPSPDLVAIAERSTKSQEGDNHTVAKAGHASSIQVSTVTSLAIFSTGAIGAVRPP